MATFRSDFNSVPNTSSLTALKIRITTCYHQWRQKQRQHQTHPRGAAPFHHQRQFQKLFVRAEHLGEVFGEKTTAQFRKFKKIFTIYKDVVGAGTKPQSQPAPQPQFQRQPLAKRRFRKRQTNNEEQLQIVAKLLSSTLIARTSNSSHCSCTATATTTTTTEHSFRQFANKMTILEGNYIEVREDYPDIDKEVRAILLANAQNGITISNIKKEYRQLTGTAFPFIENITDFLLTIPMVTAECNEIGTRIFNIKPNQKIRHLHEMVVQQRQRSDYNQSTGCASMSSTQEQPSCQWRRAFKRPALHQFQSANVNDKPTEPVKATLQHLATVAMPPPVAAAASAMPQFAENLEQNWCYQDNWNHLNNRYQQASIQLQQLIYSDAQMQPQPAMLQQQQRQQQQHHQPQQLNPHQPYTGEPLTSAGQKHRHDLTPTTLSSQTRSSPSRTDSLLTINSDYDAYLLDFPLLGDDFLLYLARMELKCRFKKYEKVLQSGLCVSGQTINAARRRLRQVNLGANTQIIVNIGSVDIMKGRPLVQIEHDFRQLLKEMHSRRFVAVLTTVAPLANYRHDKDTCEKIDRFNKFIRSEGRHLKVVDIHSCLINENGVVRFDCFQNGPRSVTGAAEPHVFWNKIGRQRVLQMIEANLEY